MDNVREKLVEMLDEIQDCGQAVTYSFESVTVSRTDNYGVADHLLAHGVTVQEWIPVSEPPKENGRYYVHVKMHDISYVKIASFSKESVAGLHDNGWHDYDSDVGFYEVKDVTHWMPLPQPPKGVSEEALPVADEATERSVAVEKTEDQRKPEGFIGHRKLEVSEDEVQRVP